MEEPPFDAFADARDVASVLRADRPGRLIVLCNRPRREKEPSMPVCDNCGNDYDKAFQVVKEGKTHTFDSFECAIARLAPVCEHCQVRIIGHGLEAKGAFSAVPTAPSITVWRA
jgi:hypothetical protein